MSAEIQNELRDYLKQKNLNAIFVSIVEAILIDKPENPVGFMAQYLLVRYFSQVIKSHLVFITI